MTAKAALANKGGVHIVHAAADLAAFKFYDESAIRSLLDNANVKVIMRNDMTERTTSLRVDSVASGLILERTFSGRPS